MSTITVYDKLACVVDELKKRRHLYARLIKEKKMAQSKADRELAVMQSIVDDYERSSKIADGPDFFDGPR